MRLPINQLYRLPDGRVVPLFTAKDFDRTCPHCGRRCTRYHECTKSLRAKKEK